MEEEKGEDLLSLEERTNPEVLGPDPEAGTMDSDGWDMVRRLGGWGAALCPFTMLEEVPKEQEEVFVSGWEEIMRRLSEAVAGGNVEEIDDALMWVLTYIKSVLRQSSRGGRAGRAQVARRFHAVQRGDWGFLVLELERDTSQLEVRAGRRLERRREREESEEETKVRVAREAAALISKVQIGKAMRRLRSFGIANPDSEEVIEQLRVKYPGRGCPLPSHVLKADPIPSLADLRESLINLKPGIIPGCGGFRQEYLSLLGRKLSDEGMRNMEDFRMRYLRAELREWFYPCWLTVQCVPLFKTAEKDTLRPLGLRNPLAKMFNKEVVLGNREVVRERVEPLQTALTRGGGSIKAFSVRGVQELIETDPDYTVVVLLGFPKGIKVSIAQGAQPRGQY